jgi:hypothetical protein
VIRVLELIFGNRTTSAQRADYKWSQMFQHWLNAPCYGFEIMNTKAIRKVIAVPTNYVKGMYVNHFMQHTFDFNLKNHPSRHLIRLKNKVALAKEVFLMLSRLLRLASKKGAKDSHRTIDILRFQPI